MRAGRCLVALPEILENGLVLVRRHAGAGVDHLDPHVIARAACAHADATALGELDRVSGKVQHNLPHARRVADQFTRQVRRYARGDLEPLVLRARGEQFGRALDQRDEVERRLDEV